MTSLFRQGIWQAKKIFMTHPIRTISVTQKLNLKELREHKENDTLVVSGVTVESPRAKLLVQPKEELVLPDGNKPCYMCALDLDVKHTDVLILSQFVRSDGCMLPRRITGLCSRQQKKIGKMVTMAQKAGLMINLTPSYCKKDPTKRRDWKKFNTYFDEETIFVRKFRKQEDRFRRSGSMYFY